MSVDQSGRVTSDTVLTSDTLRARYDGATAELDPPLAIVDLGAFDRNAADLTRRAGDHPIAGLGDAPPGHPVRAQLIRLVQGRSAAELSRRRAETIRLIQALTTLEFVNGGGTGSLESTGRDTSVTELTAGSGLVGPTLFDAYRRFTPEPALLFALPVVRRP
jgi:D-serine deaminase-like pyridoxal phosphate-dependent protein